LFALLITEIAMTTRGTGCAASTVEWSIGARITARIVRLAIAATAAAAAATARGL
jgi:hypothetical protein